MSKRARNRGNAAEVDKDKAPSQLKDAPPPPVDLWQGIPDHAPRPRRWVYLIVAVVFLAWLAFLVYVAVAGS